MTKQRRLAKWAFDLGEYTFDVEYRKGEENHADYLSRNPVAEHDDCVLKIPFERGTTNEKCGLVTTENIRKLQIKDAWCREIARKRDGEYLKVQGVLYKRIQMLPGDRYAVCAPENMRAYILQMCHDEHGHYGRDRTVEEIKRRFYWPKMTEDIAIYVRSCKECQVAKISRRAPAGRLHPIQFPNGPFEHLNADLLGPLPMTGEGYRYIIVCTDFFSKFAVTRRLKTIKATEVFLFFEDLFLEHNVPSKVTTDNGKQFTARMVQDLMEAFQAQNIRTSFYHQSANGQCERHNASLCESLTTLCRVREADWDRVLKYATYAYNTTVHSTTQEIPFVLYKAFEPALPIDRAVEVLNENHSAYLAETRQSIKQVYEVVKERVRKNQEYQKQRYDSRHRESELTIGDRVYVKRERVSDREKLEAGYALGKKVASQRTGPFEVVDIEDPNVVIRCGDSERRVHVSKLELHVDRPKALTPNSTAVLTEGDLLRRIEPSGGPDQVASDAAEQQPDKPTKQVRFQHVPMQTPTSGLRQSLAETPLHQRIEIAATTGFIDDGYEAQGLIGYMTPFEPHSKLEAEDDDSTPSDDHLREAVQFASTPARQGTRRPEFKAPGDIEESVRSNGERRSTHNGSEQDTGAEAVTEPTDLPGSSATSGGSETHSTADEERTVLQHPPASTQEQLMQRMRDGELQDAEVRAAVRRSARVSAPVEHLMIDPTKKKY